MQLGVAPKDLSWIRRRFLRLITKPKWMRAQGESGLGWFLDAERALKTRGVVVPGVIIQANTILFERGDDDHPGELLFTFAAEPDLAELLRTADRIYHMKGEASLDAEERFFSRYLGNELERVQKVPVSSRITSLPLAFVSTTMFYRRDLPGGVLRQSVFPLLADPETGTAMVLPVKHWTTLGHETYRRFVV